MKDRMKNTLKKIIYRFPVAILFFYYSHIYSQDTALGNKIVGNGDSTNYYIGHFPVTGSDGLDLHWYGGIRFGDWTSTSVLQITNGKVGIGTITPDEKLTVKGKIHTQEVRVDMSGSLVPDYVFAQDYKLSSLQEVEDYIKQNKHLPEIPSAQEIEKNGLMLAEMNMKLLKKIEEMTLYMIDQNKQIQDLKNENQNFKLISERLSKIEQKLN